MITRATNCDELGAFSLFANLWMMFYPVTIHMNFVQVRVSGLVVSQGICANEAGLVLCHLCHADIGLQVK
jgi:hypothetical protein